MGMQNLRHRTCNGPAARRRNVRPRRLRIEQPEDRVLLSADLQTYPQPLAAFQAAMWAQILPASSLSTQQGNILTAEAISNGLVDIGRVGIVGYAATSFGNPVGLSFDAASSATAAQGPATTSAGANSPSIHVPASSGTQQASAPTAEPRPVGPAFVPSGTGAANTVQTPVGPSDSTPSAPTRPGPPAGATLDRPAGCSARPGAPVAEDPATADPADMPASPRIQRISQQDVRGEASGVGLIDLTPRRGEPSRLLAWVDASQGDADPPPSPSRSVVQPVSGSPAQELDGARGRAGAFDLAARGSTAGQSAPRLSAPELLADTAVESARPATIEVAATGGAYLSDTVLAPQGPFEPAWAALDSLATVAPNPPVGLDAPSTDAAFAELEAPPAKGARIETYRRGTLVPALVAMLATHYATRQAPTSGDLRPDDRRRWKCFLAKWLRP